jgi:hypothetical protein
VYTSDLKEIQHSVPQGSVLDPSLFLLYINDLPIRIQEVKMVLLADDKNFQIKATNKKHSKSKRKQSYTVATNLVSCKWVSDKY